MKQIAYYVITTLIEAWITMLLFGAVHHNVNPVIPALSYSDTILVMLLISYLFSRPVSFGISDAKLRESLED